jgi:hypothetical protein
LFDVKEMAQKLKPMFERISAGSDKQSLFLSRKSVALIATPSTFPSQTLREIVLRAGLFGSNESITQSSLGHVLQLALNFLLFAEKFDCKNVISPSRALYSMCHSISD